MVTQLKLVKATFKMKMLLCLTRTSLIDLLSFHKLLFVIFCQERS